MTQPRHSGTPVHLASSPHPPIALVSASLSSPPAPQGSGEAVLAGSAWARRLFHPARCNPGHGQNPEWNHPRDPEGFWRLCAVPAPNGMGPPAPAPSLQRNSQGRVPGRSPGKRLPPPWRPPKAGLLSQFRLSRRFPPPLVPPSPGSPHLCPRPSPPPLPGGPAASCAPRASGRERGDEAPGAAPPPPPRCRGQGSGPSPSASSPHTSDVHFQLKLDTNFLSG